MVLLIAALVPIVYLHALTVYGNAGMVVCRYYLYVCLFVCMYVCMYACTYRSYKHIGIWLHVGRAYSVPPTTPPVSARNSRILKRSEFIEQYRKLSWVLARRGDAFFRTPQALDTVESRYGLNLQSLQT